MKLYTKASIDEAIEHFLKGKFYLPKKPRAIDDKFHMNFVKLYTNPFSLAKVWRVSYSENVIIYLSKFGK